MGSEMCIRDRVSGIGQGSRQSTRRRLGGVVDVHRALAVVAGVAAAALAPTPAGFGLVVVLALASLAILQQLLLRLWTRSNFDVPLTLWWLMGAGGLLVGAIGPVSIWRTYTGRGWTWKGRSLT